MKDKPEPELEWESCCRGRKSCPQIAQADDNFFIKDDEGNVVRLTAEQLRDVIYHIYNKYIL